MMPSFSTATSSSSVFGRFGGKRSATDYAVGDKLSPPLEVPVESDRSKLINGHKRESSILSLTSSVSDLGQNVKRSVSLRSHRTQPSTGSVTYGHKPRFPSSGNLITSSFNSSPAEEEDLFFRRTFRLHQDDRSYPYQRDHCPRSSDLRTTCRLLLTPSCPTPQPIDLRLQ
jgi:hypothetical protein